MTILSVKRRVAMMKVIMGQNTTGMKAVEEMQENQSQKPRASLKAEVTASMAERRAANSPSWSCLMFLKVGACKRVSATVTMPIDSRRSRDIRLLMESRTRRRRAGRGKAEATSRKEARTPQLAKES